MNGHPGKIPFGLLLFFLLASAASAFDFDAALWRQDARDVVRLAGYSAKLRADIAAFAAEKKDVDYVRGSDQTWVNEIVDRYARLRGHLGKVRRRWEEGYGPRGVFPGELPERILACAAYVAASAVLLDNAETLVSSFDDTIWEWRLDRPTITTKQIQIAHMFEDMNETLASEWGRACIKARLNVLEGNLRELNLLILKDDGPLEDLLRIIAASEQVDQELHRNVFQRIGDRIRRRIRHLDSFFSSRFIRILHKFFTAVEGDPYGPKSYHVDPAKSRPGLQHRDALLSVLRPGDVLVEKKNGSLADMLIPGYWGHTAMWVGSDAYLAGIGAYERGDNPYSVAQARDHRQWIQEDRCVLEAVFTGVNLNRIEHFLNCDAVAVLRLKPGAVPAGRSYEEVMQDVIKRGLFHAGQEYDFWFNVNSHNTIVCSELVYQAFPDFIEWPTVDLMDRPTISPDNVASLGGPDDDFPFEVVLFFDGDEIVRGADAWKPMWKRLKEKGMRVHGDQGPGKRRNLLEE